MGSGRDAGIQGMPPLGSLVEVKPLGAAAVGVEEFSLLEGGNGRNLFFFW